MLKIERSVTDFALCFTGVVHIHALDPDRGQGPDLARSTSPHLAALDLAPVHDLRKGKLHQPNHRHNRPKDLVPDRKVRFRRLFRCLLLQGESS